MNVDSQNIVKNNDHFGIATHGMRIICSTSIYCPPHSNWQIVKRIGLGDATTLVDDADCWLLAAIDLAGLAIDNVAMGALPIVIVADAPIPPDWLDLVDGVVLPEDDAATIGAVLERATAPAESVFVAEFSDGTARTINALSMEASRIAEQLARLAEAERASPQPGRVDAAFVRRLIKLRRDRERFFPADIFADPAWDMLLDLVAARLEGKRVPVSSLCIAAAVPTTTALRWIRSLTEAGIFVRHVDPADARRSHVEISATAAESMLAYLHAFSAVFALR
jgi:hypothetical protein